MTINDKIVYMYIYYYVIYCRMLFICSYIYVYTIMVVIVEMVIMNVYDDGDSYDDDNDIYL